MCLDGIGPTVLLHPALDYLHGWAAISNYPLLWSATALFAQTHTVGPDE